MAPCKEKVDSDISLNSVASATTCEFYFQKTSSLDQFSYLTKKGGIEFHYLADV